ncbi:hypothetical protein HK097_009069 [Rhizophlyctis rosea]|uniref:Phosphatidic acid phosphatase type 2/haloperoxidase domain-containing protein n=1 Tax=Rhizophlyctis rosea TaxID=64517 RepID=A0AAD5SBR8_9FUNG|nr:hypothetical protein HK097_009069 [Rhizophlyctis rosea]
MPAQVHIDEVDRRRRRRRSSLNPRRVAVVLLAIGGALLELVPPYERVAFAFDLSIAYPLLKETVPNWLLGILAVALPIVVIVVVSLIATKKGERNYDLQTSLLGLATSLSFTLLLTQIVKVATGGLRPNFLARCQPVLDPNDTILHRVLYCTGDYPIVKEGRKSFFSGHSSFSHASLVYLALYLSRHLNFRRPPIGLKYIICLLPLILAALIALSRVANYWHRWEDVTVGAVVGYGVALLSYRYHHPPSNPDAMGETDKFVGEDEDSEDEGTLPRHTGEIGTDTLQLRGPGNGRVGGSEHILGDAPFVTSPASTPLPPVGNGNVIPLEEHKVDNLVR